MLLLQLAAIDACLGERVLDLRLLGFRRLLLGFFPPSRPAFRRNAGRMQATNLS
jgi:hypothetical protein